MLTEGGFVVDDSLDELGIIRERFRRAKEGRLLHLIIAPTLDCNLACIYCYQSRSSGIMTPNICDRIIKFVKQRMSKENIADIKVDWYGGEPLLAQKIISYLSRHF